MTIITRYLPYLWLCLSLLLILSKSRAQQPYTWQLTDENALPSLTIYKIAQDQKGYIWMGTENGVCRYDGQKLEPFNSPLLKGNEIIHLVIDDFDRVWGVNLEGQLFYIEDEQFHTLDLNIQQDGPSSLNIYFVKSQLFIVDKSRSYNQLHVLKFDQTGDFVQQVLPERKLIYQNIFEYKNQIWILANHNTDLSANYYQLDTHSMTFQLQNQYPGFPHTGDLGKIVPIESFDETLIFSTTKIMGLIDSSGFTSLYENTEIGFINNLLLDNRTLWLLSNEGAIRLSLDHLSAKQEIFFPQLGINHMIKDRENNYWIGTKGQGVFVMPSLHFKHWNSSNSALKDDKIFSILVDSKDRVLLGQDDNNLNILNSKHSLYKSLSLGTNGRLFSLNHAQNNHTICASDANFSILNEDYEVIFQAKGGSNKEIITDQENNLWIGQSYGSYRLKNIFTQPAVHSEFEKMFYYPQSPLVEKIIDLRTYALLSALDQSIWFGTTQGIYIYKDSLQAFLENGQQYYYSVNDLAQSSDSTIWVATQADGLLSIKGGAVVQRWDKNNGLTSNTCRRLFIDEQNNLWIGTNQGINRMNLANHSIQIVNKLDGLPSNEINALYVKNGQAWVGTNKGLSHFRTEAIGQNEVAPDIHIKGLSIWENDTMLQEKYDLAHHQNNLKIEFVGINHRARGNIQYQYRLLGLDSSWIATNNTVIRYPSLNPGNYVFEVRCINEDNLASPVPATLQFHIRQPWWESWWFRLLAVLSSVGLIGFIFYQRFKRMREKDRQEAAFLQEVNQLKLQALQTQMNPHFIFNALNGIQQFLTTNDQEQAMIYLARFARLIRLIFEQSKKKRISLSEELELLNLYLELEKLRFNEKVEVQLTVDPNLKGQEDDLFIPPLLIQPIIENAFKHGLLHKKEDGQLWIHFEHRPDELHCIIKDNGVGRQKARELNSWRPKEYQSSGLATAQKRLQIINSPTSSTSEKEFLKITDLKDSSGQALGTMVEFGIRLTEAP